ncbi:hypothetical protein M6B38_317305 [Iris pallida]|uniref:Uncharacterized protein n=1 Tax=Iris pallida TaxID=29817 RepID=A0AAX6HDP7_IRIPA|nr:hypothetical protein M6B38_317305 [Iris pallida]
MESNRATSAIPPPLVVAALRSSPSTQTRHRRLGIGLHQRCATTLGARPFSTTTKLHRRRFSVSPTIDNRCHLPLR